LSASEEQLMCCIKSHQALHEKWAESGYEAAVILSACSASTAQLCIYLGATKEAYMKAMEDVFDSVKLDIEKQGKGN